MDIFKLLSFSARTLRRRREPRLPPEAVAAVQTERLRKLVRNAVEKAPFYRERYRGIDPDDFRLEDLPPTDKREIMADFDRAVTDPRVRREDLERFVDDPDANAARLYLGRYLVSHSSGSQGQPFLVLQEPWQEELLMSLQIARGNVTSRTSALEGVRRLIVGPKRLAVVAMPRGFYTTAVIFQHFPEPARAYIKVLRLAQTDPDLVEKLNAFRPDALTSYAGTLDKLALEALAGNLRLAPRLKQVVSNSEVLTEQARARVAEAFAVPVMDNYAACECPHLSQGCPAGPGAHVNADWVILEVVDEDYRPVPPGTPGKRVLVTNLASFIQPIIRYEITDVVTMADSPCDCGNRLPRVARIEGRRAEGLWVRHGGRFRHLPARVFKHALDHLRSVREWQLVQTDWNDLTLRLELLPGAEFDREQARRLLDRQLELTGFRPLLNFGLEVVALVGPDPATGKVRHSVSLVGPRNGQPPEEERDPPDAVASFAE